MTTQLHAAEAVLLGHPDKRCDAIADVLVQEASRRDKRARCAVVVSVHQSAVFVAGRIACDGVEEIDVAAIVRATYASAGYGGAWGPDPADLKMMLDLCRGPLPDETGAVAEDQAIVIGYAVDLPGTNHLPPERWLAGRCLLYTSPSPRDRG